MPPMWRNWQTRWTHPEPQRVQGALHLFGAGQNLTGKYMHYVYVLKSLKDLKLYIGKTANLKRRFNEHQKGKVKSTKNRRPLSLIFYEAFAIKGDAAKRERYFKTSKGKVSLGLMLREILK
jgi:putative endonuclease